MRWPVATYPTGFVNVPRTSSAMVYTTLTASATPNTKGAWATLISAIGGSVGGTWINVHPDATAAAGIDTAVLLDLAVGSAGNETIIASDLIMGYRGRDYRGTLFPIHLPAGATLRGRVASVVASTAVPVAVDVYGGDPGYPTPAPGRITTYGAATASSGGTTITPSATAATKGSYAQLTASTTYPIHAIMLLVQGATGSVTTSTNYIIDVAVGSAGNETVVVPDWAGWMNSAEIWLAFDSEFYPMSLSIPSGVRLSARCAADISSATALEIAAYAFTY